MTIRSIASGVAALLFASLVWGAASAPHLINGHPDLNGVWENGGGIDFVKPVAGPKGSVCVTGCAPSGQKPAPRAVVVPDRPVYKPQFVARVQELAAKPGAALPSSGCPAHRPAGQNRADRPRDHLLV